ncbi:membrane protein [Lactobacillus nasalidis]|uniref:Membrane protein n=2 Tax=Lactobacillus nasalidis TaxID=2797258 RepID=A0ABQ3W646_9LACO|nr:ECF transporter S component [Lactobacillus nasalidis]GHW01017.1 membrane protein [Lactobacillus nasalidis]
MNSKEISSKNKTAFWSFKLSAHAATLIPAAVGINYVAKVFAESLKLPVWLGSLGTFLASMLAGPVAGALSGFINNVVYGLTLSPISTVYALTSIGIGLAVAWLKQRGFFKKPVTVLPAAILVALVSAVISTPLNVAFWGGQTGIAWGDALFASLVAKHVNIWLASFADEFVLDLLDKTVVAYLAFLVYKQLPLSLRSFFAGGQA